MLCFRSVNGIKNKNIKNSLGAMWNAPKTILHGRDAILRVRDKLLISNMILQLWADVKYHVPTGLVFRRRRAVFMFLFQSPPVFNH